MTRLTKTVRSIRCDTTVGAAAAAAAAGEVELVNDMQCNAVQRSAPRSHAMRLGAI